MLLKVGCACPPIYGDPGLLISKYYKPKKVNKKFDLGIIPHFSEYEKVADLYQEYTNILVINMASGNVEKTIDEIVSCSNTVSSSLHGIVFSHSYSIPVRWIKFSHQVFGDDTKFYDYFRAVGRPVETYIDGLVFRKIDPETILNEILDYKISIDFHRLEESLFFNSDGLKKSTLWKNL